MTAQQPQGVSACARRPLYFSLAVYLPHFSSSWDIP